MFGLNRGRSVDHGHDEKLQDSRHGMEETITGDYALVINGHSLIILDTSYWTGINHFFIWGSTAVYFAILFAMQSNGIFDLFPAHFPFVGNGWNSLGQLNVWLVIFLTTVVSVMPVITFRSMKVDLSPMLSDQVWLFHRTKKKQKPFQRRMQQMHRASS